MVEKSTVAAKSLRTLLKSPPERPKGDFASPIGVRTVFGQVLQPCREFGHVAAAESTAGHHDLVARSDDARDHVDGPVGIALGDDARLVVLGAGANPHVADAGLAAKPATTLERPWPNLARRR